MRAPPFLTVPLRIPPRPALNKSYSLIPTTAVFTLFSPARFRCPATVSPMIRSIQIRLGAGNQFSHFFSACHTQPCLRRFVLLLRSRGPKVHDQKFQLCSFHSPRRALRPLLSVSYFLFFTLLLFPARKVFIHVVLTPTPSFLPGPCCFCSLVLNFFPN